MYDKILEQRMAEMKKAMLHAGIDFYLIPTADFHHSEYVSEYFKGREYLSGFTGSNGTLVISQEETALWTDGRYFVQAEKELQGSGIRLMKMGEEGVPTITEYVAKHIMEGQVLGFDGRVVDAATGKELERVLSEKNATINFEKDLLDQIWKNRPAFGGSQAKLLADALTGETIPQKIHRVRDELKKQRANLLFLSRLDDLMWMFNLRGRDVAYNPVLMSYGLIAEERIILFLQSGALNEEVISGLSLAGVEVRDYHKALDYLGWYLKEYKERTGQKARVQYDIQNTSYCVAQIVKKSGGKKILAANPTERMKAIKNPVELEHLRDIYLKDSVLLTRFLYWIAHWPKETPLTEYEAQAYLDQLRLQSPLCRDLSFGTISAYGENAAMMHYEASKEDSAVIRREGFLLVDSGGQYDGGTTDVTRTIPMGSLTAEMKRDFTLTLMGMLRLAGARFLHGCTGINLDILARSALWMEGMDYKCGTGHGVGYMLNVHEGPHGIRWKAMAGGDAVLEEGMIVTDEPGVYKAGKYGIRIENVLEVKKSIHTQDGQFMEFKHLTWVPISREAINANLMPIADREAYNRYQAGVYEKVSPYLDEAERIWLEKETEPI